MRRFGGHLVVVQRPYNIARSSGSCLRLGFLCGPVMLAPRAVEYEDFRQPAARADEVIE
jgi:hypothetical protein